MLLYIILLTSLISKTSSLDADLVGDYCAARPSSNQCCEERDDDCSSPILGTLCYCDVFCKSSGRGDCCPDYDVVCLGAKPIIESCWYHGRWYDEGESFKINCNLCKCENFGSKMEILCSSEECIIDEPLLSSLSSDPTLTWTPSNYSFFWGQTLEDGLRERGGVNNSRRKVLQMSPKEVIYRRDELPPTFDARTKWGSYITPIQDQNRCGMSWATSTISVVSDRFAIMSRGQVRGPLSLQQLFACNTGAHRRLRTSNSTLLPADSGCNGGYLTKAWNWINRHGLVSEECLPWSGSPRCIISKRRTLQEVVCPGTNQLAPLRRTGPLYRVKGEYQIMKEIMDNGPVQGMMRLHRDLFLYKNGIYQCPSNVPKGIRHTGVRILGWGEEFTAYGDILKYWVVANSWGPLWGMEGTFKLLKGSCDIEDFILASWIRFTE